MFNEREEKHMWNHIQTVSALLYTMWSFVNIVNVEYVP